MKLLEIFSANYTFILEFFCFTLGVLSVWYARKENILVYPTGLISTLITVYLLYLTKDLGNMLVNIYFSFMSIFGWYNWKFGTSNNQESLKVSYTNKKEKIVGLLLMVSTCLLVFYIYKYFNYSINFETYLDLTSMAIFFTAMWFMANKKIESWMLWIVGNVLALSLYFYKHWYLLGVQYIIFTILAVLALIEWKNSLKTNTN